MTSPTILGIDHVSLMVADTAAAAAFYTAVFGATPLPRPDLGFPGAWLALGPVVLHLLELPNPDPIRNRPTHGGRDRHIALRVASTAPMAAALEALGVSFTRSQSGRDALFFRDGDGNAWELTARS
ncbi:VOC family protein [Halothiobacillus sp. DCM-1]|uniref:VOC family protein n=1 Tax=Halothiobacillus sp. DCM-1 TaxID=3112558 RepID=UPI0032434E30